MMRLPDRVSDGDRRSALEALRDKLASELEMTFGRDAAPLVKELRAVLDALDAIPDSKEVSSVDEFTARREARRTGTTDS